MTTQSTLAAMMTMVLLSFLLAGGPFITILSLNNKGLAVEAQQYQYNQQHRNSDQHNQYEESAAPKCQPTKDEEVKYDWERYNYYELLGIPNVFNKVIKIHDSDKKKQRWRRSSQGKEDKENQDTNSSGEKITTKEIRKAYRKEAQKHHPDKQVSKRKSNNTTTATTNVPTIEESNDRFTKIAEAYEFLSDTSKREEYDLFLEYCHAKNPTITEEGEGRRIASVLRNRFHGLFTNFAGSGKDPFSVFEDFFFGWSDDEEDEDDDFDDHYENVGFDPNDPFSHLHHHSHKHYTNHHHHQDNQDHRPPDDEEPIRVFNEQQNMYDPMTGENVIRVLQTEEFAAPSSTASSSSSSSFYYRIIAQDFKERYDPYHSKQVLVPITDPYLHDDGYRKDQYNYHNRFTTNPSSTTASPNNIESIFHSWEVLTPDSRILMSPNRRYLAGLSPDCELLITTTEDNVIWSSKRPYGSNGYAAHNCFALLEGPHFVVKVGQHHPHSMESMHNQNNRILWHSDSRKDDVDESTKGYYEYEDEYGFWHKRQRSYVAQLDNDGALTVYSVWNVPASPSQQQQQQQRPQNRPPKLMATKVVNTAKDIWYGRVAVNKEYKHLYYPSSSSSSSSSSKSITYKRCIYSTSKFSGCHRLGRLVTQGFFELSFRVNQLLSKINEYADLFLDLIYEDDTVLWELKKSVLRNGNAVGTKMIGSSAKVVRKLMEILRRLEIHNKS
mmetsp:Transcript_36409/g.40925  ORF Transcript_36409/g.40925 Transcript_36409/m.40925 type:complete len:722 (-) Transcript_36409:22-2187(-)